MKSHIPAFAHASFVEFVSAHAAKGDEDAARLLAKLPKRRNGKVLSLPGKSPETKRAEHKASTATVREAAYAFTGGKCIACMGNLGDVWHLHHVVSGGLRRARQSTSNTVAMCMDCHRLYHRNDLGVMRAVLTWAMANGDSECRRAITYRLAKLEESRASRAAGGTR